MRLGCGPNLLSDFLITIGSKDSDFPRLTARPQRLEGRLCPAVQIGVDWPKVVVTLGCLKP